MATFRDRIRQWGQKLDRRAERFAFQHPYLAFLAVFVGAPLIMILVLFLVMLCVALPLSLYFGYF